MAKMVPAELRLSAPRSERMVFEQLRKGPEEWVILCSVEIPVRDGDPREIDFLVMIPDQAVICLEVKGDSSYRVRDGVWFSGRRRVNQPPFDQARDEMYALRDYLKSEFPTDNEVCYVPLDFAVMFTNTVWPQGAGKTPTRQFFDSGTLQTDGELVNRLKRFARQIGRRGNRSKPTVAVLDRLRKRLIPDVAMRYAWILGPDLGRINSELLELTQEQFGSLGLVQDDVGQIRNSRVLFSGGAGTGKTMLALQLAQLRMEAGDKVALVCQSPVLGNWMRTQMPEAVDVGNIRDIVHEHPDVPKSLYHRFEVAMSRAENPAQEREAFYRFGVEALEIVGQNWDYLIVDEFQYFFAKPWINLLNLGLKDGLNDGNWAIFGDFEHQTWGMANSIWAGNQYGWNVADYGDALELLRNVCPSGWAEAIPLTINCRNTVPIARESLHIVGDETGPTRHVGAEGPEVTYRFFDNDSDMISVLSDEADELARQQVSQRQIAIVCVYRPDVLHGVKCGPWSLWARSAEHLFYPPSDKWLPAYPVHVFAGMESEVVIVLLPLAVTSDTEVDGELLTDVLRSQIYVAMTRAKGRLIVVAHNSHKKLLNEGEI